MKNLKILMCALLVLCGSVVFAACGKKEKPSFDASKISISDETVVFDKHQHMLNVSYEGLDENDYSVSYAVQVNDGERSEFSKNTSLVNAGVYKVYIKLTADGYKTYESSEPITFTIQKRPVELSIATDWVTKSGRFLFNNNLPSNLTSDLGHISWEFKAQGSDDVIDVENLTTGNQVHVSLKADSYFETNYDYGDSLPSATLTVVDNYVVKQGENKQYADSFAAAVALISSDDAELYLYENVSLTSSLKFNNSVKIFGNGNIISAGRNFEVQSDAKELIHFDAANKTLTLENVELNGNDAVACLYVNNANLVLNDNARIYRGRVALAEGESDDELKLTGGVRIVGNSNLTLNGGKIYNNHNYFDNNQEFVGDNNMFAYAQNLWLGANVTANFKYGSVNNVWVDAQAGEHAGTVTLQQDEGKELIVPTIYLHNCEQATHYVGVEYKSGSVNGFCVYSDGQETVLPAFKDITYHANDLFLVTNQVEDSTTNTFYNSFETAFNAVQENGTLQLFKDVEFNSKVDITKSLTINANNHEISASETFAEASIGSKKIKTLLYISETESDILLQVKNATLNGSSVARAISAFAGRVELSNCTVSGGADADNYRAGGLFFTGKSSASIINCNIINNVSSELEADTEAYCISGDIWVGANAKVEIGGSETNVGYVYVNANQYSSEDKGGLTVIDGNVQNVWLEFDANFGAELVFDGGSIGRLVIDQETESETIAPEPGNSYCGGRITAL